MPENTRAGIRAQQDTRAQAADAFGRQSAQQQPSLYGRGIAAADSSVQGPASQYGPLAQSRLMQENKLGSLGPSSAFGVPFQTGMSPSRLNARQPEQTQIDVNRQSRTSSAESFREQIQDIRDATQSTVWSGPDSTTVPGNEQQENLGQKNNTYNFQTQETNIGNLRPKFEMQTPPQNQDGGGKQNAFGRQGISALEQFAPSADLTWRKNLFSQKKTNGSAAGDFRTEVGQTAAGAAGIPGRTRADTSDGPGASQDWEQSEVLERIRRQLEDLTKSIDAAMQSQEPLTQSRYAYNVAGIDQVTERMEKSSGYQPYIPASNNSQKTSSPLEELNKLSQAEISAEANRIMGGHKSLDSLSQSKFNQHMRDAEANLKAGRYYRAASSFSLASVYQPENPLALAGRGHALFAAGEYVSSALFISRALAISPAYLRTRVDLVAILGGQDKLAGRIADIEQWLARSGSSRLQFLLGYVYYRTGQLTEAKKAIDAAYEKTPESAAVQVMKITIDNMLINQ
jgi:tetratricopeptide (TPR) repeat protein